jgi:hypothetical protein
MLDTETYYCYSVQTPEFDLQELKELLQTTGLDETHRK